MPNAGVVVVVAGQDNTQAVFRQIENNLKNVSSQAHETENALAQLGEGAKRSLEAIGIAVGLREALELLKEAVHQSLEFGESIAKASESTGLSAGTLSVLHYAADITNSDFDKLSNAVGRFDKTIGQAADGNKKAESFMKALGLNARELVNDENGAEIAFKRFAQVISETENPIRRTQLAAEIFGQRGGAQLIPVLLKVGENFEEFKRQAQEAGVYLDGQGAQSLASAAEQLKRFQEHVHGAELSFTQGLIPGLNQFLDVMAGGKNNLETFKELGKDLAKTIAFIGEVAYSAASALEFLFSASEGSKLTEAGRKDIEAAKQLQKQAEEFHKIAFGPDQAPHASSGNFEGGHHGDGGFQGAPDPGELAKLDSARKARDAAQLRLDEQMLQLRAQLAKQDSDLQLAQLDEDHKRNLISDQDYYDKKLALQKAALDAQRQAALDKQKDIDKNIAGLQKNAREQGGAVAIEDEAKILELRTRRAALDGEIAKINAEGAKAEIDAAEKLYELSVKRTEQVNQLAAKREEILGGTVTARLQQSADAYDIRRQDLIANYGEGSPELSNADFTFQNEQDRIRAKGAEESYGGELASINARRQGIGAGEARGTITTLEAQRQKIALDQEEAEALQPVLEAYRQLAQNGDLQASEKVAELQERISELKNPVDEVAAHIRDSFDGAFESLFENLDQGVRGFENFAKSIERIFEQAAYKKFLEPFVQKGLDALIPNKPGGGYGDAGIGGVGAIPANPSTDVGGGAVRAATGILGKLGIGIPGLGDKKGSGGSITIQLVNESGLPLKVGDVNTSGNVDKDKVLAIIQDDFDSGGLMRTLMAGFGLGR